MVALPFGDAFAKCEPKRDCISSRPKRLYHAISTLPRSFPCLRVASLASKAFTNGIALLRAGHYSPKPFAFIERRIGGQPLVSVLLTEWCNGRYPWTVFEGYHDAPAQRDRLIAALGESIAALHRSGFRHPDLKNRNLLIETSPQSGSVVHFIDLETMTQVRKPHSAKWRAYNLTRLCTSFMSRDARRAGVTLRDWHLFCDTYLGCSGPELGAVPRVKDFVASTINQACRMLQRGGILAARGWS